MQGAPEHPSYVERRLRELGVERRAPQHEEAQRARQAPPGRGSVSTRSAHKAPIAAGEPLRGADGLLWRQQDLALVEQLVSERRNVVICGGGGTGKSTLAAILAGRSAAARPGEAVHCVLEHYDGRALRGAEGIVTDPGGLGLRASLRRGLLPPCGCLVFDEIYTSSGAHSLLEAWRRGLTGIGALVVTEPEQGDCLGRLALLEESQPGGFSQAEVLGIYRRARPAIVRTVQPGVFEHCGDLLPTPPWLQG